MDAWTTQLRKGVTDLIVLGALARGEAYGYELLQRVNAIEGLSLTESSVYPLLARLKAERLVKVRAAPSPSGPPRRYYELTPAGRKRLADMRDQWTSVNSAVNYFLSENGHEQH